MDTQERVEILKTLRTIAQCAARADYNNDVLRDVLRTVREMMRPDRRYEIILESMTRVWDDEQCCYVNKKITTIKALREASANAGGDLGLKAAKDLAESTPCVVLRDLTDDQMEAASRILRSYGCGVRVSRV